ncbi:MAG: metallophosphoesterase family protein [Candidatus Micrarchaeota archaeon]|nr:metallophosphoesterase family protein [Candidatus Micrarchaeota archaeon]
MKIAITSDYHLGYSDDALPQAAMALAKALEVADCIIAAGDLFDVRVPKQEVVNDSIKLFKKHSEEMAAKHNSVKITKGEKTYENNPVIAIPGTHERRTKGLVNVVDLLDSGGMLVNCHNKHVTVEKNDERVAIIGMAGVPEEYAEQVIKAANFTAQPNCFNIFMFHQTLKEVIPMASGISLNDLPLGFDLYVNGHIHWRRELKNGDKTLLIPGSTVITQMRKNEMEKKGFWLYDTATKHYEYIYIDSRPLFFKEIQVENATGETVKQAVETAVGEILLQNKDEKNRLPLVKIKLRGSLAKGINSSAIDATVLASGFENAEVYIDKEFDVLETLKEKIELLRKLKTEEKSVAELGIAVLKDKLKRNNFNLEKEEELFSLLSEGEVEKAITLVKNSKVAISA